METKTEILRAEITDLIKKGDLSKVSIAFSKLADLYHFAASYAMAAKSYEQAAKYCTNKSQKLSLYQLAADDYASAGSFFSASLQLEEVINLQIEDDKKDLAMENFEIIKNYLVSSKNFANGIVLERIKNKLSVN